MPLVLGGVGLLVVIVLVVMMNRGVDKPADTPKTPPVVEAPKAPHVPAASSVKVGAAKAGKTPAKPAPALTPEMLSKAAGLLDAGKALCNDGVKARSAGDNQGAREKQSAAKDKIDAAKQSLQAQALWQEEADLGDWAQPAEYSALGALWNELSALEKKVRMNGGT